MDEDELELGCLFCGLAVEEGARDFCQLDFTTGAGYGTFVCHTGCLRERAHDPEAFPEIEAPEHVDGPEPAPALVEAWHDLVHVLGHVQEADLGEPAEVTRLARAIEALARDFGVDMEHHH